MGEKGVRVNSISPGAIVTGIFGKNAGLEGSKADRVAGVVKESLRHDTTDSAGGNARGYRAGGGLSCERRVRVHQRPGIVVDGGHTAVTRGWSFSVAGRAEMAKRIKEAAAAL